MALLRRYTIQEINDLQRGLTTVGYNLVVFDNGISQQDLWTYTMNNMYNPEDHKYDNEIKGRNINFLIENEHHLKNAESLATRIETIPEQFVHYSNNYHIIRFVPGRI